MKPWMLVVAAMALALGGCNMVTSDKPLFSLADTKDAPIMKVGLWVTVEPGCDFDPKAKRADFPKCVRAYDVEDETAIHKGKDGEEILLAGKDPTILQMTLPKMGEDAPPMVPKVLYVAMDPTAFDAKGRVTAASGWFVLCGPPNDAPKGADGPPKGLTEKLLPGLTARGENCLATTQGAVRAAAIASRTWNPAGSGPTRWLREGKE